MSNFSSSIAERAKLKRRILPPQGFNGGISRNQSGKRNRGFGVSEKELCEVIVADDHWIKKEEMFLFEQELHDEVVVNRATHNGSTFPSSLKVTLKISNEPHESSFDELGDEESDLEDHTEFKKGARKSKSIHDLYFNNCGTHTYSIPSSYYLDSNDTFVTLKEGISCKCHHEHDSDYLDYPPPKKKEKVCLETVDREEKSHYHYVHKTNMKKKNKKLMDGSNDIHDHEKRNAKDKVKGHYMKLDYGNAVKYRKFRKGGRKDDGDSVDAILDSIIKNESVDEKKSDEPIPLKFKFDESEDQFSGKKNDEYNGEDLFQEMDFLFKCEEIGSYKTPMVENVVKDDTEATPFNLCQRGEHGDTYLEEQTGMRCRLCGAVVLESRYVIPKFATYVPDKFQLKWMSESLLILPLIMKPSAVRLLRTSLHHLLLRIYLNLKAPQTTIIKTMPTMLKLIIYSGGHLGPKGLLTLMIM